MLGQLLGRDPIDQQLRRNDCGISAAKTVCNLLDVDIDRSYIEKEVAVSERGSSLDSLKRFFDDHQPFEAEFHLLDVNDPTEVDERIAERIPCIVAIERGQALHYVVIESVEQGTFHILDPSEGRRAEWSLAELRRRVYMNDSALNMVEMRELGGDVEYFSCDYSDEELTVLYNKLSYFTYVEEEFGFEDDAAARAFLEDLIENQDLSAVPKHFRSLAAYDDQLAIRAPVILTVHSTERNDTEITFPSEAESVYVTLLKSIGSTRRLWYIFIGTALIAALMSQLSVFISQLLIDEVLPTYDLHVLTLFAIGVGVFRLFELALSLFVQYVAIHLGNEIDLYFLSQFDRKLSSQPVSYLSGFRKGDLVERLSDSFKIRKFFTRFFSNIFVRVVISVVNLLILLWLSWQGTLIIVAALLCFTGIFLGLVPRLRQVERERFRQKADLFSRVVEKIEGLIPIRSFGLEERSSRDIEASSTEYIRIKTRGEYWNLLNRGLSKFTTTAARFGVLVLCAHLLITQKALTLGQLIAFVSLSARVLKAFRQLLKENLSLQRHRVILRRFFNFGLDETEEESDPDALPSDDAPDRSAQGIESFTIDTFDAENVAFEYEDGNRVLDDATFHIERGETACITGPNGSGKSTLGHILGLLYVPTEGTLKINGTDHSLYAEPALRRKISFTAGDDVLFNEPLRFNLTLGRPVDTERVIRLARAVGLYDFIVDHPDRLDRPIHEGGQNLSAGQKQKVIVLRALLSDAEVLIFDEVLRSIDDTARTRIQEVINEMEDRTFIFITHSDLDTLVVDRHYQMQYGELTEVSTT